MTPGILSELERSLFRDFAHLDRDALVRRAAQVALTLALHIQPDAPDTDAVAGVNAKDRHVAAIALAAKADILVSNDRRLRRQLTQLDIRTRAVTGDEFMVGLHAAQPDEVNAVIETMVAKRVRRPVTRNELLGQLCFHGLPRQSRRTAEQAAKEDSARGNRLDS